MSALSDYLERIENWDTKTFLSLYKSDFSKRSKQFAKIYSFFGSFYFWGIVYIIWFFYGYITKDYYLLVLFTGAFDQSILIHILIRYRIIRRNRPYVKLRDEGVQRHDKFIQIPYLMPSSEQKSFPSGHVTFFLLFGIVFAYYFGNWVLFFIILGLDIVMGISRLILGVHFPTDIIFGFLFGLLYALLYFGWTYVYWVEFYYWIGPIISDFVHFWM